MSNIVSSWLQYEALKFVSFPLQVRAIAGSRLCVRPPLALAVGVAARSPCRSARALLLSLMSRFRPLLQASRRAAITECVAAQVLSKSSKILFTMVMGRLVSGRKHSSSEYLNAATIGAGLFVYRLFEQQAQVLEFALLRLLGYSFCLPPNGLLAWIALVLSSQWRPSRRSFQRGRHLNLIVWCVAPEARGRRFCGG